MALDTSKRTGATAAAQPTANPRSGSGAALSTGLKRLNQRPLGDRDRMLFTERLALLLETGVSLNLALATLRAQAEHPAMVAVLGAVQDDINEGKSFSVALSAHPKLFARTFVNLVAAGEQGGFMPQVLQELLQMEEKRERLRSTLIAALIYPAFLILFSFAVVVFVLVVVFPKFAELFAAIADQLPASTLVLMWMSEQLREHWLAVGGAVALAGGAARYWLATPAGRERVDGWKLTIPWVRDFFLWLYLVQSLRVLGMSLANGVGIMDALAACRDVVANTVYRRFIRGVELRIEEGGTVASGFAQSTFVPLMVQQMISTGEQTGSLPRVMARVADFYERELSNRAQALAKGVEPVMLLVMGAVVGVLVASLILPIFKLSRAVY